MQQNKSDEFLFQGGNLDLLVTTMDRSFRGGRGGEVLSVTRGPLSNKGNTDERDTQS